MDPSAYYLYQAKARGLHTVADVQAVVAANTPLYDRLILPWLPANRAAAIYEVACGPGIFLHWLARHGYTRAEGSDSSTVQIELAAAGGLRVKLADSIGELRSFAESTLDCIVGFDFYEHLPKEVMLDFFSEAARVLKPGGCMILRGPNGDSPVLGRALFNDITHQWALTTVAFGAVLRMVGFRSVEFKDDALASIQQRRWLKLPFAWAAQAILRSLLRSATRESIQCLSASFFLCARK